MIHEQLTPNELIWLFIDGAASPDESDMLFTSLAGNTDLQHDFHNAITLRSALEHSRERIAVPPVLTNRVMGAAGITVGSAALVTSWWSSLRGAISMALQKSAIPLASAAAASVLTWFVMSAESSSARQPASVNNTQANTAASPQQEQLSSQQSSLQHPEPTNQSAQATYATESPVQQPRTRIKYVYIERPVPQTRVQNSESTADEQMDGQAVVADRQDIEQPSSMAISPVDYQTLPASVANQLIMSSNGLPLVSAIAMPDTSSVQRSSQYMVSVRGISGLTMYPYRDLVSSATMFNNITGTLTYAIHQHHALGIEVGTEAFPMYALTRSDDGTWHYAQKPQMMFGGGLYQYTGSPLEEFNALQPVVRGVVGGTNWGPLVKGMVGVQYNPNDIITLGLGMEGTSLWYTQQSQWFSTQKLSFTYWIGLRL